VFAIELLGIADDTADADGIEVLAYDHAKERLKSGSNG
jgi:hypothetical protein